MFHRLVSAVGLVGVCQMLMEGFSGGSWLSSLYSSLPEEAAEDDLDYRLKITSFRESGGLCDADVKQFAGFFEAGPGKKYFFWFFESRSKPSTDPTFMWLTGGPGCSSQLALLGENGPCSVNDDGKGTTNNEHSWTSNANGFWVDQPPGTGFSEGSSDHDEKGVAEDLYAFLQAFFKAHPQYNRDFYVTGESYAGHYIPAITHQIFVGNQKGSNFKIDLKGMAIGNGMTDPEEQYKWYPDMAYKSGTAPSVVSEDEYQQMQDAVPSCVKTINSCNAQGGFPCSQAFMECNRALFSPYQQKGLNPYDMREKCEHPPLCYDFSRVETFLNDPDVQAELGVSKKWQSCNMMVNMMFNQDFMHNFHQLLPDQIEAGIRVLIYAGDVDYICNWLGNKKWALGLDWSGKESFNKAADQDYKISGGKTVGKIRSTRTEQGGQFAFLQVYEAGHMVPMNQPEAALSMLNDFMSNKLGGNNESKDEVWRKEDSKSVRPALFTDEEIEGVSNLVISIIY